VDVDSLSTVPPEITFDLTLIECYPMAINSSDNKISVYDDVNEYYVVDGPKTVT
jgi:hypothetical protein